ncbi:MAG: hypothetical protein K0U93_01025 [Gammaproteobacteria bacterium]|nr:hypothetical protein [Gammaproteobacteria bacterium]
MSEPTNVQAMDKTKKNSTIVGPVEEEATVMMDLANPVCFWNGAQFDDGTTVSDGESVYECSVGKWVKSKN